MKRRLRLSLCSFDTFGFEPSTSDFAFSGIDEGSLFLNFLLLDFLSAIDGINVGENMPVDSLVVTLGMLIWEGLISNMSGSSLEAVVTLESSVTLISGSSCCFFRLLS